MNYHIPSPRWMLNDLDRRQKNQLLGHVQAQDYFGTLATVLNLLKQNNEKVLSRVDIKNVDEVIEELSYLQDNHQIQ